MSDELERGSRSTSATIWWLARHSGTVRISNVSRISRSSSLRAALPLALATIMVLPATAARSGMPTTDVTTTVPVLPTATATAVDPANLGSLGIRLRGKHLHRKARITLVGKSGKAKGTRFRVTVKGRATVGNLAPGKYRIKAQPVRRKRAVGLVDSVRPKRPRVLAGRTAKASIRYSRWSSGRNAIAYAPLSNPSRVVIRGSVPRQRAWSTSKVLVVMAYLKTVVGGDPGRLSPYYRKQIKRALTASDFNSLLRIRGAITGGSGAPMTQILRSIGDNSTTAPNRSEGSMSWSIRNQLRFMAALHDGKVVSKRASRYVLKQMKPIGAHSWGLGRIDASAYKGGWLTPNTETRQMGIVGNYAVAIITSGVGPAKFQTDGDWAHERQMNRLAKVLKKHLRAQR